MKNLELSGFGVSELTSNEKNESNGGLDPVTVGVVCGIIGAIWAINEMSKDAQAGWNSYKPKNMSF